VPAEDRHANDPKGPRPKPWYDQTLDTFDDGTQPLSTSLKVFGVVAIAASAILIPLFVIILLRGIRGIGTGAFEQYSLSTTILYFAHLVLLAVAMVVVMLVGIRLLRNKRRHAALAVELLMAISIVDFCVDTMLYGLSWHDIFIAINLGLLVALSSYIDPALAGERAVQRQLRKMDDRDKAERGTLGFDETGRGYITLNFFNLFWIFTVCSIIGLIVETIFWRVNFGEFQNRAGLLFGPFSPIYGFGGLLMTVALNRFHNKSFIVIFLVSALIGGAFEYFTSWFLQYSFGIVAWDYSGTWLNIGGRTNGEFMIFWGIMGLVWIKVVLPPLLRLVNLIPWNWRYSITYVCAALLLVDGLMTLQSLDCWYQREAGQQPSTNVERFYAEHFDNDFMSNRFQSMSIDPSRTTRVS
jgi:uncharacterized membrane protein